MFTVGNYTVNNDYYETKAPFEKTIVTVRAYHSADVDRKLEVSFFNDENALSNLIGFFTELSKWESVDYLEIEINDQTGRKKVSKLVDYNEVTGEWRVV